MSLRKLFSGFNVIVPLWLIFSSKLQLLYLVYFVIGGKHKSAFVCLYISLGLYVSSFSYNISHLIILLIHDLMIVGGRTAVANMKYEHSLFFPGALKWMFPKISLSRGQPSKSADFKCVTCGKCYVHNFILNRHIKYECGKEPQFQCPHCPYRSKQKGTLKNHIACRHFVQQ